MRLVTSGRTSAPSRQSGLPIALLMVEGVDGQFRNNGSLKWSSTTTPETTMRAVTTASKFALLSFRSRLSPPLAAIGRACHGSREENRFEEKNAPRKMPEMKATKTRMMNSTIHWSWSYTARSSIEAMETAQRPLKTVVYAAGMLRAPEQDR